jgi:hypothetical protein
MRREHRPGLRVNYFSIRGGRIEHFPPALLELHRHLPVDHAIGFTLHHSNS